MAVIEQQELGFTYADLGAALLNSWQLPDAIVTPVQYHVSSIGEVPADQVAEVAVVNVSAVICRAAVWRSDVDEPVPEFDPIALQLNAIDDERTESIMREADDDVIEAMTLLLPGAAANQQRQLAAAPAA
jgi:hypothetical protein